MTNDTSPQNVLSSQYLSTLMLASLRPSATSSSEASSTSSTRPHLTNEYDALALAAHASLLAVGFQLVDVGPNSTRLMNPSTSALPQPLPSSWNENSSNIQFRYTHPPSGDNKGPLYSLFVANQSPFAHITARIEGGSSVSAEVEVREYISGDGEGFPFTLSATAGGDTDRRRIENIFISAGRLSDFGKLMRVRIAQKLVTARTENANQQEEADAMRLRIAEEKRDNAELRAREPDDANRGPAAQLLREDRDPAVPRPTAPEGIYDIDQPTQERLRRAGDVVPPDFDDEHRMLPSRHAPPLHDPGFPRYGERDLNPDFGLVDPLRGPFGRNQGGVGGGGGMIMGLPDLSSPLRDGRLGEFDHQRPPGARFDSPVGEPGRHPRGAGMHGRFPGGEEGGPFGGPFGGPPGGNFPGRRGGGSSGGFGGFGPGGIL